MKARHYLAAAALLTVACGVWLIRRTYSAPPEVAFAIAKHDSLISTLSTNGKVEPSEFVEVRALRPGIVERVLVERGRRVQAGELLALLDEREARIELAAAEARLRQAQAALEVVRAGGRASELAELDASLARARLELDKAEREFQVAQRLLEKQAASRGEVELAKHRVEQARAEVQGLEARRAALASPAERASAEARLREAEAALKQAAEKLHQCRIVAPLGGLVYDLRIRRGDYLQPGDLVASVGKLDPVRVRVYVDEPELGRLAAGMAVTLSWDALPGRVWHGRVEQMPTQVKALGNRQVGELLLTIDNPGLDLLPGANVNAEIRTQLVANALTIPKEAVRRMSAEHGVFVLDATERVRWRPVKLGAASLTRVEVREGLAAGERVALGTQHPLRDGSRVRPVFP